MLFNYILSSSLKFPPSFVPSWLLQGLKRLSSLEGLIKTRFWTWMKLHYFNSIRGESVALTCERDRGCLVEVNAWRVWIPIDVRDFSFRKSLIDFSNYLCLSFKILHNSLLWESSEFNLTCSTFLWFNFLSKSLFYLSSSSSRNLSLESFDSNRLLCFSFSRTCWRIIDNREDKLGWLILISI